MTLRPISFQWPHFFWSAPRICGVSFLMPVNAWGPWGPFLETPHNFPGPISIFSRSFVCQLLVIIGANLPICFTKLQDENLAFKINKNCIAIREYRAPKIVFGPGKLSGVLTNEPRETGLYCDVNCVRSKDAHK